MAENPAWLDVNAAAVFTGKSVSTLRRWIASVEGKDGAGGNIRRQPFQDKGGEKILIARAFLAEQFGIGAPAAPPASETAAGVLEILERQIAAKDNQISAMLRDAETRNRVLEQEQHTAAELAERLRELAALNAALQTKILLLSERAGSEQAAPGPAPVRSEYSPAFLVAVAVIVSLCAGLLLYLVIA